MPTINFPYTHNNLLTIWIIYMKNLDSVHTLICLQALFRKIKMFFFPSLDLSLKIHEEAKAIIIPPRQNNPVISEQSRNQRSAHLEIVLSRFHSSSISCCVEWWYNTELLASLVGRRQKELIKINPRKQILLCITLKHS